MGLGNSLYAMGDVAGAEQAYRQATLYHPTAGVAFNNLAQTLADQDRWREAEQAAQRAVSLGGPLLPSYEETLHEILTRPSR
jgi:Flp pilus assembly protein TadD